MLNVNEAVPKLFGTNQVVHTMEPCSQGIFHGHHLVGEGIITQLLCPDMA